MARQLEQAWPATNTGWGATVTPLLDQTVGGVRPALLVHHHVVEVVADMAAEVGVGHHPQFAGELWNRRREGARVRGMQLAK